MRGFLPAHAPETHQNFFNYRPHPKDGEGNSFTLLVGPRGGGGGVQVWPGGGGVRSKVNPAGGGGGQAQPAGGGKVQPGGVRSSQRRAVGVRSSRGGGGGSASCVRAVCLLRSRRKTFLFNESFQKICRIYFIGAPSEGWSSLYDKSLIRPDVY